MDLTIFVINLGSFGDLSLINYIEPKLISILTCYLFFLLSFNNFILFTFDIDNFLPLRVADC